VQKTFTLKAADIAHQWYVVDAAGKTLGRLSSDIAHVLRGKHKPTFTPHMDNGDYVIVVNAEKIRVTGKRAEQKMYYAHSGYPGGLKARAYKDVLQTHPRRILEHSVRGMLPRNTLGAAMYRRLKVYAGPTHPHQGQTPRNLDDAFQPATRHAIRREDA
jgi:large subunit ribosomal protein L13